MREISFIKLSLLVLCIVFSCHVVQAQSSAFTYQGKLTDTSMPANGTYDFQFTLFDAVSGGNQIGLTVTNAAVQVTNGIFTVNLDYGSASFPGTDRFLEIGVRPGGNGNPRTVLARSEERRVGKEC